MRTLYYISLLLFVLGVCAIPGCIEFGTGIALTIVMIVIGAAGTFIIPREYFYEDQI